MSERLTFYVIAYDEEVYGWFSTEEEADADLERQITEGGPAWHDCRIEKRSVPLPPGSLVVPRDAVAEIKRLRDEARTGQIVSSLEVQRAMWAAAETAYARVLSILRETEA